MFSSYLVMVGNDVIPMKYISERGYKCIPKHRLDKSSDRNVDGELIRDVATHRPSSVTLTLNCETDLSWLAIYDILTDNVIDEAEGDYNVTFYNPHNGQYETERMYIADIDFTIDYIHNDRVYYDQITLDFVGY